MSRRTRVCVCVGFVLKYHVIMGMMDTTCEYTTISEYVN